ncbi:hypothetical protein UMNF18_pIncFV46 (plasmid) [Escherichia coli UMNF18]|nr:hypothetical protein UMNF18_pIncFV46 [Escherichia coli UMNF18]
MITSIHITTPLNYRRAVSVRSDFPEYHNFPEVYHAEEIIISLFSAPARRITGQEDDTTYSAISSRVGTTCCDDGRWRCVGGEEDPELPFFGSQKWRRGIIAAWTQKTSNCCDEWTIAP